MTDEAAGVRAGGNFPGVSGGGIERHEERAGPKTRNDFPGDGSQHAIRQRENDGVSANQRLIARDGLQAAFGQTGQAALAGLDAADGIGGIVLEMIRDAAAHFAAGPEQGEGDVIFHKLEIAVRTQIGARHSRRFNSRTHGDCGTFCGSRRRTLKRAEARAPDGCSANSAWSVVISDSFFSDAVKIRRCADRKALHQLAL
jgi:hypothetical protein